MLGFEFYNGTKIVSGDHAVQKLPRELVDLGVTRPLLITDATLMSLGIADPALSVIEGFAPIVFDEVPQDSDLAVISRAIARYQGEGCDGIITLGGGSVIDTAKSVAISLSYGEDDFLALQGSEMIHRNMKPLIVLPTTAGTGSEVTCVAVVANHETDTKLSFTSYKLTPHVAILDPKMTTSLPPKLTITTGMDGLTHAIESIVSAQRNPISDSFAKTAIRLIKDNVFLACEEPKNTDARISLAVGSLCAGVAFSNAMVGVVHALGHALGGACGIPHGHAMMLLLPHGMQYNYDHGVRGYSEALYYLDPKLAARTAPEDLDEACIDAVEALNRRAFDLYGLEIRLRDLGVEEQLLPEVAEKAFYDGAMLYNPIEVSKEDALAILRKAY